MNGQFPVPAVAAEASQGAVREALASSTLAPFSAGAGDRHGLGPGRALARSTFSLPWRRHQDRQAFQFPHVQDKRQRMLCHPTYFSRLLGNDCLLGKHFKQLGQRCPWLR